MRKGENLEYWKNHTYSYPFFAGTFFPILPLYGFLGRIWEEK